MDYSAYNDVVKAWIEEMLQSRGVNAEVTLKCCSDIEQYARQNYDAKLLGFANYYSGETYYILNDGENLFRYIIQAISYLDTSGQWNLVARSYNILGITSSNRGNAPIALDYYLTGLSYCKKYHLDEEENIINMNLGTLYLNSAQYNDAQKYYEQTYRFVKDWKKQQEYAEWMACIQINLGKSYLKRGMEEKAQECITRVEQDCLALLPKTNRLCLLAFKISYYHFAGKISLREACIEEINDEIDENMVIMDVFDDFYELCRLLLDIEKDEILWHILGILEKLTKNSHIVNLQRKIIALKIRYYKMHKDNASYLQATGLFYELTEIMERENKFMISSMLSVRNSLERANARRREVEQVNAKLQMKSETDALTKLPNRFRINDYSELAFEQAKEQKEPLAVEMLDIDYFKEYNDTYGHQAGDECITTIAEQLMQMQNEKIFCARYGGDEFIIIYRGMAEDEVFAAAEDLRKRILACEIEHVCSKAIPQVTISQGICYDIPRAENKNWDFLHAADMMLYNVKKSSRNSISMGHLNKTEIQTDC